MNIGIVTTWFERGAAYVSRAYMQALSREHCVFIYARGEEYAKGDPKWDQNYVMWGKQVPAKPYMYIDYEEFKDWIRNNAISVVIFNEQHSWDVILKSLELDIIIGAYVDYYTHETVPFFWLYDFLLCNTKRHYSVFEDHPQAYYIPWGTDLDVFKPQANGNCGNRVTFFHSCGLSPLRKGTDVVVSAFQPVRGRAELIIHSQRVLKDLSPFCSFPDERADLERMSSLIVQDRRIRLIEAEVGAPGLYYLGDVYVYPARLDGIGLTVPEALASGLPVITTDSPPMNEFVVPRVNGILVKVESHRRRLDNYYWPQSVCSEAALAEAMQFYVDNIDSLRDFQHQARSYAEANLDWCKNTQNLCDWIRHVSRRRQGIDRSLIEATAQYERLKDSTRWQRRLRSVLGKMGGRLVKRALKALAGGAIGKYHESS